MSRFLKVGLVVILLIALTVPAVVSTADTAPKASEYARQGEICLKRLDYNGAASAYTEALRLQPGNSQYKRSLAICYHGIGYRWHLSGNNTSALQYFRLSIQTDPSYPDGGRRAVEALTSQKTFATGKTTSNFFSKPHSASGNRTVWRYGNAGSEGRSTMSPDGRTIWHYDRSGSRGRSQVSADGRTIWHYDRSGSAGRSHVSTDGRTIWHYDRSGSRGRSQVSTDGRTIWHYDRSGSAGRSRVSSDGRTVWHYDKSGKYLGKDRR